jgi:hypothetical protein
MNRRRIDRKNRMVLLLCLMLLWGFCPAVRAEEPAWKEYRTTATEGKLSYDPKSIVVEDRVVDVWSRFEPAADERIREMKHWVRFDCARKRMKLLKTITVYRDGSMVELPQKNKFEAIEPGSNPAVLGAEVCGEKNELQAAPQEPVTEPVEKPLQEVLPPAAPPDSSQGPVTAPAEQPSKEGQAPALLPQHQNTSAAETHPPAPAGLPR